MEQTASPQHLLKNRLWHRYYAARHWLSSRGWYRRFRAKAMAVPNITRIAGHKEFKA
jgi:hypothetical protein